jgi:GT2 family glycosyltransferase/glycosyltransferase involved in cell wall biosynthesis
VPVPVSIIIPVFNKLAFTRQCLERLARDTTVPFEVVIVDNASSDGTQAWFETPRRFGFPLTYIRNESNLGFSRANNVGAARSAADYLLFLNNDTLPTAGWLRAMVAVARRDARVGVVGIKQLFPYTNRIHHTGIVFDADRRPQHIYPHADGALPFVNRERAYQAVTGSCMLMPRDLFETCGGFDEGYRNGYEDVDLCLRACQRGRTVVCCTSGFIYHYGQISETRTADDDQNAARLADRWRQTIAIDDVKYFELDRRDIEAQAAPVTRGGHRLDRRHLYVADDLSVPSALSWVTTELIRALDRRDVPVAIRKTTIAPSAAAADRALLEQRMIDRVPVGGVQIRWSHYWPQHLGLDLNGWLNLELFVINYLFARPGSQPWDYWLQCLAGNGYGKLPLSTFNLEVLQQLGVATADCAVIRPGYSPEIARVDAPKRRDSRIRLLTVTNSHDLERYGTHLLLDTYWSTFTRNDDVVLVMKDYGGHSGDTSLQERIRANSDKAAVEYISTFTTKEKLIELYRSCDAFVSSHRGEGYGMKIIDALACGLPTVTPLFGGPGDFCTPANCLPVDYTLVPVGDCYDTRSLHITNGPLWAEPDRTSLARQLKRVVEDRDLARRLGAQAERDVLGRFTWDEAARHLHEFIEAQTPAAEATPRVAPPAVRATEASPYWLGCRVSVVIPTFNRSATLARCLAALDRQTILAHEFEVVVVDDGSTDDTRAVVESYASSYPLKYVHQSNAGPGTARNTGVRHASGELVLFIGDDIMADERLLESHLLAHATRPAQTTAILGHIDWPAHMKRSPVMDYVCGPSTLQFAYAFIPTLPALDFRFFYTSNISLKRQFLVEAADDNVAFDPAFTQAAFEDSELAMRLERRGLEIVYAEDARVTHEHYMDVAGFSRRERSVGRMAAVFYRKHPHVDDLIQLRWIDDWTYAVDQLVPDAARRGMLEMLDSRSHALLLSIESQLESAAGCVPSPSTSATLDTVLGVLFDLERTAGKVQGWYSAVLDVDKVETAMRLIPCARRLEFLMGPRPSGITIDANLDWLDPGPAATLLTRLADVEGRIAAGPGAITSLNLSPPERRAAAATRLRDTIAGVERELTPPPPRSAAARPVRHAVISFLRRADLHLQHRLGAHGNGRWLREYRRARTHLLPVVRRRGRSR